jgi:hypothetical protein
MNAILAERNSLIQDAMRDQMRESLRGNSYQQDQLIQQQQTQRTQMQADADKQQTMMWVGGLVVAALIVGLLMRGKK